MHNAYNRFLNSMSSSSYDFSAKLHTPLSNCYPDMFSYLFYPRILKINVSPNKYVFLFWKIVKPAEEFPVIQ